MVCPRQHVLGLVIIKDSSHDDLQDPFQPLILTQLYSI